MNTNKFEHFQIFRIKAKMAAFQQLTSSQKNALTSQQSYTTISSFWGKWGLVKQKF